MNIIGKIVTGVVGFVGVIVICVLSALIFGIVIMLLWNWLVPVIIPTLPIAQKITYWQGWGLSFLLSLLFSKKS